MAAAKVKKKRLTRNDWLYQTSLIMTHQMGHNQRGLVLALAMEMLSNEEEAKLTIDTLCLQLGVTKRSFYVHIQDRTDFVQQFPAYPAAHDPVVAEVVERVDGFGPLFSRVAMGGVHQKENKTKGNHHEYAG